MAHRHICHKPHHAGLAIRRLYWACMYTGVHRRTHIHTKTRTHTRTHTATHTHTHTATHTQPHTHTATHTHTQHTHTTHTHTTHTHTHTHTHTQARARTQTVQCTMVVWPTYQQACRLVRSRCFAPSPSQLGIRDRNALQVQCRPHPLQHTTSLAPLVEARLRPPARTRARVDQHGCSISAAAPHGHMCIALISNDSDPEHTMKRVQAIPCFFPPRQ